jgi:hypothetical protein
VEKLCYRCNAPVGTGVPFCPQCNAPQFRVVAEAERAQVVDGETVAGAPVVAYDGAAAHRIRWSAAIARTIVAAIASVALLQLISTFSRSAALAFLALPLGGWFAVYLYSRRAPGAVTAGMGARLGAVTGFFVFAIGFAISAVGVMTDRDEVFQLMQKGMKEAAAANPSPQADALIQQISTPSGMMTILFLAAVLFLFVSLALCAVGGAAGAAIAKRR